MNKLIGYSLLTVLTAGISLSASAAEPELKRFSYTQNIASGVKLSSYPEVTEIWYEFSVGVTDESPGITPGMEITVTKDGNPFRSYTTGSTTAVRMHQNWNSRMVIEFGEPLEPGVYMVHVPAETVTMTYLENVDGQEQGTLVRKINPEINTTFTVVDLPEYTVWPTQNRDVMTSDIATVTVTFPEGCEVTVTPSQFFPINMKNYKNGTTTQVTTYTATADGNVVTLRANSSSALKSGTYAIDREYNYITIPANVLSVTYNGKTTAYPMLTLGNWALRTFDSSTLGFEPSLDTRGLTLGDIREITVRLPEGVTWTQEDLVAGANRIMLSLYPEPKESSFVYQYVFRSVSDDGRSVTMEMKPDGFNGTVRYNVYDVFPSGDTSITIEQGKLRDASGGAIAAVTCGGWKDMKGVGTAVLYSAYPAIGGVVETDLSLLKLFWSRKVSVVDPDALITITRHGRQVASIPAGSTTTANAVNDNGALTVEYIGIIPSDASLSLKEPGEYVITIPAAAFRQVSPAPALLNDEISYSVYIPRNIAHSVSPAPASFSGTAANPVITVNEEVEAFTEFVFEYPEATAIELLPTYSRALQNSTVGTTGFTNALKNADSPAFTKQMNIGFADAEVIDSKHVRVTLSAPYQFQSNPTAYVFGFKLMKGVFAVTSGGEKNVNGDICCYYQSPKLPKPLLESPEVITAPADFSTVTIRATQPVFGSADAWLQDADGRRIADYTGSQVEDSDAAHWVYTVKNAADIRELPYGVYTWVIPAKAFLLVTTSYGTMRATNADPYEYTFNYADPGGVTGIEDAAEAVSGSYDVYSIDGRPVKLNAAPAELSELEEGLYIINGKKTCLRK